MAIPGSDTPPLQSHSLAIQLGYSVANLGKSVVWTSFESIMLFYMVSIAGFGPLMAGMLLAVSLLWDAAFDLAIARWTDYRGAANGLAKLVLAGAPVCGIGFWLIFVLPSSWAVAVAIIACRIGYSLCDVGHNTLLIRVSRAPGDAARVSGFRLLFSASGVALLALASGFSLSLAEPMAQRQSLAAAALIGAGLYVGTLFIALWATHGLTPPSAGAGHSRSRQPLRSYGRNRPFRQLLCLIAVQAAMAPLFQRALPFYGAAVRDEQGLAWVRPIATTSLYGATADLHRVTLEPAPLGEEEAARSDAIVARCETLEELMADEEMEETAYAALEEEFERLREEYQTLHSRPPVLSDEMRGKVGTFLTLGRDGKMTLETTYFSETPLQGSTGDGTSGSTRSARDTSSLPPEAVAPGGKPLSARLHDELAVQRRDILAASILADPGLALDYMLCAMTDQSRSYSRYGTTVAAGRPQDPQMPKDQPATQAQLAIAEARESLNSDWTTSSSPVERFEAFRALDDDAKAPGLARTVASSLEAKPDHSAAKTNPLHARLASILEIDVAKWWRPTSANFFDRVSKGTLLALLTDVGGPVLAARYVGSKMENKDNFLFGVRVDSALRPPSGNGLPGDLADRTLAVVATDVSVVGKDGQITTVTGNSFAAPAIAGQAVAAGRSQRTVDTDAKQEIVLVLQIVADKVARDRAGGGTLVVDEVGDGLDQQPVGLDDPVHGGALFCCGLTACFAVQAQRDDERAFLHRIGNRRGDIHRISAVRLLDYGGRGDAFEIGGGDLEGE